MNAETRSGSLSLFSPYFPSLNSASDELKPPNGVSNSEITSSLVLVCHDKSDIYSPYLFGVISHDL